MISISFTFFTFLPILLNCAQSLITTKGRRFIVNEGDSVKLPCNVQDIANDAVVIWKREDQVLFTDEEVFHEDRRFQLQRENSNYTLIIERVEPYDGAKYVCEITSPEMSVTHTLEVNVHPTVSISPDANPLFVNADENMIIKCLVSGNPPPKVTWTRKDGRKMPERAVSKDGQLKITRVAADDSGFYECTASNNVGADAHDTVEVRVQLGHGTYKPSAPWVDSLYAYIPVRLDQDLNLTCKYNAEPSPQIDWFYNGFTINFSDERFKGLIQYGTRRDNYSESILAIKKIKEDNFGDYTCRIANNLGIKQKTIHVSGRPGPPQLNVSGIRLLWSVHSIDPVIEYQILYRFSNDDTWQQFRSIRANKDEQNGDVWSRSEDLIWLQPGQEYDLQVKARNTLGWGSLARSYITLKTPASYDISNDKKRSSVERLFALRSTRLPIISFIVVAVSYCDSHFAQ